MYSHVSKNDNTEQLNASKINPCYNNWRMLNNCGEDEKRKTKLTPQRYEEFPLSHSAINEYDLEFHSLSNSKLESTNRHTVNSNNQPSSETFRKRGTRNSIAIYLVVFFNQMINKKQLAIAIISYACGVYALYVAFSRNSSVYGYESRHQSAYTIKTVLLLYGLVQVLLNLIFFFTYATTTKIGERKWCCQIIRFIGCIIYLLVSLFVLLIGLVGFYWVVNLYGRVEYEDRQSADYVDTVLYKSSLFTFCFHLCFVLLKCCWWY
ncbi:Uncharacterized protein BM_BM13086 [Brugia malayi]|uniref:Bm13086 n=1 Tax=Brugia malayi TaxID=6279 RepID=A0A0K0IWU0_BRUMA|nr:Uncharacterized protein BM_BM13086 [Brugia malayi]CDP95266.1 Bm13086 [Brugia malayi]VIO92173.1 Uncharacterized protein BM_BM13086 [Brugia malayi]